MGADALYLAGGALIILALTWAARHALARRSTRATLVRVKDGDTFVARYRGEEITVRCATFDARETNERGGKEATAALTEILTRAKRIELHNEKRDQWGRTIAVVLADGRMVGVEMVARSMRAKHLHRRPEFAAPWRGSRDKTWGRIAKRSDL